MTYKMLKANIKKIKIVFSKNETEERHIKKREQTEC